MRVNPEAFANATPISLLFGKSDRSPARLNRSFREAVESEIERLIDLLDAAEPDADFEPYLADQFADDREEGDCDDEDSDHSGAGDYAGLMEQEHGEGCSLGATEDVDQDAAWSTSIGWTATDGEDDAGENPEDDPAESGIGDACGLFEQTGRGA